MGEVATRNSKYLFAAASAILFAAFAFQLVYHAVRTGATVDEPDHILAGYRHWDCGDFGINPEHPPLLKLLATVPLYFRELSEPPWECGSKMTSKIDTFSYGNTFVVENGIDSVLIPTRVAASLMSMILALLIFVAAWEMFGRWEALTALAIAAFEPNLIAQGSLVMTDMAISATAFGAVYALYRFGKQPTWARFVVAALAFGLMLASKHSAVIFVGILFLLMIADTVLFRGTKGSLIRRLSGRVVAFAVFLLIGIAILWSFYGFRYYAIPSATEPSLSVSDYIRRNGRPEQVTSLSARVTEAIGATHILPESYVLGMADVIAWGSRNTWIMGRSYSSGKWFYFPIAFVVKSSIALLLLLPLGLIYSYLNREKWREAFFMLVPAAAFFIIASSSNFTNGSRHILPVYGFLILIAGAGAVWSCRKNRLIIYALVALLAYHAAISIRTAPNYIAFANDFWGGYENTYRIFRGANLDIGNSTKLMNEYLEKEGITDCWFAGYVHPEMIRSVQPCRPMPSWLRILVSRNLIEAVPPVIEGTVLINAGELVLGGDEYLPIARSEPVAVIAGGIFVYRGRFEVPLVAAISRVHRANHFMSVNQVDEAIAEGRQAIAFGPTDARTHLALGLALSQAGQKDEARMELETAIELAKKDPRFRNAEVRAQRELEVLAPVVNDSDTPR